MKKLYIAALAGTLLTTLAPTYVYAAGENLMDFSNKDRWLVRLRAINVDTDVDSSTSIGGNVTASITTVPELDISYFWTDHIATELILAVTPHDMGATGTALGELDLGDVWLLPPTLTLQYHFLPENKFRPYVGAGVNYTVFFSEDSGGVAAIDYEDNFGYDLQAGFDYEINEHLAFNMDIKKVYLNTDVDINGGAVTADVDLDPWIYGVGLAYRF